MDPASAKCATCHAALLAQAVKHPVVSECLTCHEFKKTDGKTVVGFVAPQTELCVTCHDAMSAAAAGKVAAPHAPVTAGCTDCHNPHTTVEKSLLKAAPPALCIECHDAAGLQSSHKRAVASSICTSCHTPHGSETKAMLLSAKQHVPFAERSCASCHRQGTIARTKPKATICFACHDEKRFTGTSVHSAVKQGKCTGCHEPHLSPRDKLVRNEGPALCVTCHAAIKAKIESAGAHPPAREDCTTCHDPHQSNQGFQLHEAVPSLCITCHDASDKALVARHLGADMTRIDCVSCHDPHGSAEKPLITTGSIHMPFRERSCKSCHTGGAKEIVSAGTKDLCLACHGEIRTLISEAKVSHPAMEMAECTECHAPHASKQDHLIKFAGGAECTSCHSDKSPDKDEVQHGAIGLFGCRGCHEPHGGNRARLLRADSPTALCLGCHDTSTRKRDESKGEVVILDHFRFTGAAAVQVNAITALRVRDGVVVDHPINGHRATGKPTPEELNHVETVFSGELGCLTCHDPHKGPSAQHFAGGAKSSADLCVRCHKK